MEYLDAQGLQGATTDKIVEGGTCGKERPDRIYEFGDKIVDLEVDEHQHKDRACECEQTRMVNLGQTYGGTPVYFIRFNPDDYKAANPKKAPEPLEARYKLLAELIRGIRDGTVPLPKALVSALYLYYDGWDGYLKAEWEVLTSFE